MRLIDAKTIEKQARMALAESNPVLMGQLLRYIRKQPTIDAVEVVRCKDCRYWHEDILACEYLPRSENGTRPVWYGEDFRSYGERKNDETD